MDGVATSSVLDSESTLIRAAVAADVPVLRTLIHEFASFEGLKASVTEEALLRGGFGSEPKFRALIAEQGRQPTGYALYFDYYSRFRGGSGIFLEDIYVRDQFRGKGIGKALFARLAAIAQGENCVGLMFNVLDWNIAAINVYRNLGATFLDDWKVLCLEGAALRALAQSAGEESRA
jgi:GNAT superfamily N-acetyltransferase